MSSPDFRTALHVPCSHHQGSRPRALKAGISSEVGSGGGSRDLEGSAGQLRVVDTRGYTCWSARAAGEVRQPAEGVGVKEATRIGGAVEGA